MLDLRQSVGVPHTLKELGVDESRSEQIVAMALADPSAGGNPLPFTAEAARSILGKAFAGDLSGY